MKPPSGGSENPSVGQGCPLVSTKHIYKASPASVCEKALTLADQHPLEQLQTAGGGTHCLQIPWMGPVCSVLQVISLWGKQSNISECSVYCRKCRNQNRMTDLKIACNTNLEKEEPQLIFVALSSSLSLHGRTYTYSFALWADWSYSLYLILFLHY